MSVQSKLRIGSLLSEFGMVADSDVERGYKLSTYTGLPIGKCLVLLECLSSNDLKAALEAQALVRESVVEREILSRAMHVARRQQWTLSDALLSLGYDAHSTNRTRLGELLSDGELINDTQVAFALQAADFSCLPLGNILTSFSAVEQDAVNRTLGLQSAIRTGSIDRASAIAQIRELNNQTLARKNTERMHFRLGELLKKAHILTDDQLERALDAASRAKKLTGQYLIDCGQITEETLTAALCMQTLLDAELTTVELACEVIGDMAMIKEVAEREPAKISFYDFLRASGYLNSHRLMVASALNPVEKWSEFLPDPDSLRNSLLKAFPAEASVINAAAVVYTLLQSDKLTLNQALLIFAFRQKNIRISDTSRE